MIGADPGDPIRRRRQTRAPYLNGPRPNAAATEVIRNLRTSILMSNIDAPPQVIAFTSSVPERKARRRMRSRWGAQSRGSRGASGGCCCSKATCGGGPSRSISPRTGRPGLAVALVGGGCARKAAVVPASEAGIRADVIMGEKSAGERGRRLRLAAVPGSPSRPCAGTTTYIVIDTPPVLVVPDARVIGQSCDAIVYCVQLGPHPTPPGPGRPARTQVRQPPRRRNRPHQDRPPRQETLRIRRKIRRIRTIRKQVLPAVRTMRRAAHPRPSSARSPLFWPEISRG